MEIQKMGAAGPLSRHPASPEREHTNSRVVYIMPGFTKDADQKHSLV